MIQLFQGGAYVIRGKEIVPDSENAALLVTRASGKTLTKKEAQCGTISHRILCAHNKSGDAKNLQIIFDSLTSHDITYVGIIQTARASGMDAFPMPYVLTNCHNTLCAVGGTINEDDHKFALSAVEKYGGIYVPPHIAVIHSYNREVMARCGSMILGSDSHTRYGALGTMGVGEGGGELSKQLVGRTYDIARPDVVGVYLTGTPQPGVGPHDVALSLIAAVYKNGYVKNKVMEFIGDGIMALPVEYRNGIDVMTTETACWTSVWQTDNRVQEYYEIHGRPDAYRELSADEVAYYDGFIVVDLAKIEPVIALPFHPSNVYTIRELRADAAEILHRTEQGCLAQLGGTVKQMRLTEKIRGGEIWVDQGTIAGCAGGTFDNICCAADILSGQSVGNGSFSLSVYPGSQPAYMELIKNGCVAKLMAAGAIVRSAFCGPCFGAGDTPANGELSVRHTTRNFPNREGSKPGEGQIASVALMDARSVAATAANGGRLTAATEIDASFAVPKYYFDKTAYEKRVYNGWGSANPKTPLHFGPNIKDWPQMPALAEHLLLKVVSYIEDPVTTTDELIPSGETSSYRSNPLRLAEFALSRKDPQYVPRAKEVQALDGLRAEGSILQNEDVRKISPAMETALGGGINWDTVGIGSTIYAHCPGDGSAREQAASVQRVLGGAANLCKEYATKRYRSNLINWGMIPFRVKDPDLFENGSYIFVPGIRRAVLEGSPEIKAWILSEIPAEITLLLDELTPDEKQIIAAGCLINYYRN